MAQLPVLIAFAIHKDRVGVYRDHLRDLLVECESCQRLPHPFLFLLRQLTRESRLILLLREGNWIEHQRAREEKYGGPAGSGWYHNAEGVTNRQTYCCSHQHVPRPGNRGREVDHQHKGERDGHADHDTALVGAFGQHAKQKGPEHRAVDKRGDCQTDSEDRSPAACHDCDEHQQDAPRNGQPSR